MSSMASTVATVLVLIVAAAVVASATDYTVGDSSGWSTGVDYSTWASDKTFKVGDTLAFNYGFLHSVDEVSKSDYDGCSTSNSLKTYSNQNTKITLDKPGSRYFICGTSGHCGGGMKLAVTVGSGSDGGNGSPSTPSTPSGSSPNSPSTPSGSSPDAGTKKAPTTTGTNAAAGGFNGGSALVAGAALVGLALMG